MVLDLLLHLSGKWSSSSIFSLFFFQFSWNLPFLGNAFLEKILNKGSFSKNVKIEKSCLVVIFANSLVKSLLENVPPCLALFFVDFRQLFAFSEFFSFFRTLRAGSHFRGSQHAWWWTVKTHSCKRCHFLLIFSSFLQSIIDQFALYHILVIVVESSRPRWQLLFLPVSPFPPLAELHRPSTTVPTFPSPLHWAKKLKNCPPLQPGGVDLCGYYKFFLPSETFLNNLGNLESGVQNLETQHIVLRFKRRPTTFEYTFTLLHVVHLT